MKLKEQIEFVKIVFNDFRKDHGIIAGAGLTFYYFCYLSLQGELNK